MEKEVCPNCTSPVQNAAPRLYLFDVTSFVQQKNTIEVSNDGKEFVYECLSIGSIPKRKNSQDVE